jgi:hypothetical protein
VLKAGAAYIFDLELKIFSFDPDDDPHSPGGAANLPYVRKDISAAPAIVVKFTGIRAPARQPLGLRVISQRSFPVVNMLTSTGHDGCARQLTNFAGRYGTAPGVIGSVPGTRRQSFGVSYSDIMAHPLFWAWDGRSHLLPCFSFGSADGLFDVCRDLSMAHVPASTPARRMIPAVSPSERAAGFRPLSCPAATATTAATLRKLLDRLRACQRAVARTCLEAADTCRAGTAAGPAAWLRILCPPSAVPDASFVGMQR